MSLKKTEQMARATLYTAIIFCAFIVQTTSFHFLPDGYILPDLPLILAIYGGLRWGKNRGGLFGGGVGLLGDFLSYGYVGGQMFSKGVCGFVVGELYENYMADTFATRAFMVFAVTIADTIIYVTLIRTFIGYDLSVPFFNGTIQQGLVNFFFSLFIIPAILWIDWKMGLSNEKYDEWTR